MAAYATIDQVQSFIPKWKVAGDTNPSTTEVIAFCERLSARIDGIVAAQGYSTPVTGVTSLNIVESICLVGTAWYVGRTLFPTGSNVVAVDDYRREFEQMMLELTAGTLILVDAARDSSGTSSVLTATTDVLVASAMVPFFTRQMVF